MISGTLVIVVIFFFAFIVNTNNNTHPIHITEYSKATRIHLIILVTDSNFNRVKLKYEGLVYIKIIKKFSKASNVQEKIVRTTPIFGIILNNPQEEPV